MSPPLKTLVIGFVIALASGPSSAQNPSLKTAMHDKLGHAERMLEAVVTADYAGIRRSGEALARISETEIASWQFAPSPAYAQQATRFIQAVQGLREAAASRDIDAATTEFNNLVLSCSRCHAHALSSWRASFQR